MDYESAALTIELRARILYFPLVYSGGNGFDRRDLSSVLRRLVTEFRLRGLSPPQW